MVIVCFHWYLIVTFDLASVCHSLPSNSMRGGGGGEGGGGNQKEGKQDLGEFDMTTVSASLSYPITLRPVRSSSLAAVQITTPIKIPVTYASIRQPSNRL